MQRFERCPKCGNYGYFGDDAKRSSLGEHQCAPAWQWRADDWHGQDEWSDTLVYAVDAQDAATAAAELYDQEDYPLLAGGNAVIYVKKESGQVFAFIATGESVPKYNVRMRVPSES